MLPGMDILFFVQVMSAVFLGNMASLAYGWFLWTVAKADREDMCLEDLPLRVLVVGAGVPLLAAIPIILMR